MFNNVSEILNFLIGFFDNDVFSGFGVYSLFFFPIRYFSKKKEFLNSLDQTAIRIIIISGILLLLKNIFLLHSGNHILIEDYQGFLEIKDLAGSFHYFLTVYEPLVLIVLSLLLQYKSLSQSLCFRLFFLLPLTSIPIFFIQLMTSDFYSYNLYLCFLSLTGFIIGCLIRIVPLFFIILGFLHLLRVKVFNRSKMNYFFIN